VLTPGKKNSLFSSEIQTSVNLENRVFRQELMNEAIKNNLFKTFVMPIFKEINNINIFSLWKQTLNNIPINTKNTQKQAALLLPEPGEYIRKIGEHFISFIHKLDQSETG
jgi:hypothetical protein